MDVPVAIDPPTTSGPGPIRRPVWRRVAGGLAGPFRFARRRPMRAIGLSALTVLAVLVVAAGGMYVWFRYHLREAQLALERGHNAAAARHIRNCQWVRPNHPEVRLMAARVARRSGYPDEAERILDEYWADIGDDDALVLERLLLRAVRGEIEAVGPQLAARIAAGGPDAGPAREALITGYLYRFRWVDAAGALEAWLTAEPDSTTAVLLRGKLAEHRLQTEEATADYRWIVEADPDHDEARLRLTTLLLQESRADEAVGHLEQLRPRLPGNAEVAYQWGTALALLGRRAEAKAALDESLRLSPYHTAALAARGQQAALDGDDAAAADWLGQAVRVARGNVIARYQYAQVLNRLGKTTEAAQQEAIIRELKTDLDQINRLIAGPLQASPNDPALHYEIALIALRAGEPDEALRWFRSALQADPNHLPTHQTLTGFYYETGKPVLAARHRAIAQRLAGRPGTPSGEPK